MKKHLFFLAALLFAGISSNLFARPIDAKKALDLASTFFTSKTGDPAALRDAPQLTIVYTATPEDALRSGQNLYYVVNRGSGQGFVIISADDRTPQVLGYSEHGSLNKDDIENHPNLSGFFTNWSAEMEYVIRHTPDKPYAPVSALRAGDFPAEVKPLLETHKDGHIAWDQSHPYNYYCPSVEYNGKTYPTVSGCVATAMASAMRWHRWPDKPKGKIGYDWKWSYNGTTAGKYLGIDLDKEKAYNWDDMTPRPSGDISDTKAKEIGRFLYHVGVSVKMNYGPGFTGGSGAWVTDAAVALVENFKYKSSAKYVERDRYTAEQWMKMVKTELKNGPIVYAGYSGGGGHCFILDGYDNRDYVHIDWGWSAMSNGYFLIHILDPGSQGTGGGSGGFSSNQQMIINLVPDRADNPDPDPEPEPDPDPDPDPEPEPETTLELSIAAAPTTSVASTHTYYSVDLRLEKITNTGNGAYTGKVAVGLEDKSGKVYLLKTVNANNLSPYSEAERVYHANFRDVSFSKFYAGDYTIVPIYSIVKDGEEEWHYFNTNGATYTLDAKIQDNWIYFSASNGYYTPMANAGPAIIAEKGGKKAVPAEASLYPTTASDEVNVDVPVGYEKASVYTVDGKLVGVYVLTPGRNTFDVVEFAEGNYVVELVGNDVKASTLRFIKQ